MRAQSNFGLSPAPLLLYSCPVTLSDHEKRLLAEMEAALTSEDPRLVSTLTGKARTRRAGRVFTGLILTLAGMAILLAGLISQIIAVGILGFLVSLVGLVFIFSNFQMGTSMRATGPKAPKPNWSSRLEERWERRNYDQ